jgi:hypothetical protein
VASGPSGWVPPEVDTKRANVARVYDYWLGGDHNFLADQDVARTITAVEPNAAAFARANREFLGRAVRVLAAAGIRQFLDIGSGIPANGNVHEIAQSADPCVNVRSRAEILRFFDGFDLLDPGVVYIRNGGPTLPVRRKATRATSGVNWSAPAGRADRARGRQVPEPQRRRLENRMRPMPAASLVVVLRSAASPSG